MHRREERARLAWQLIERQMADGPPKGSAWGVRNTPIAYEVIGEPADCRGVVVLLMGLGMNGRMWGPAVRRARARGYAVVTVDARGGGRSSVPWRPWSTATMADD